MLFALSVTTLPVKGAEAELIAGPVEWTVDHPRSHRTDVVSAQEMFEAATSLFPSVDAGILCAAVADFTPIKKADHKIKREGSGNLHLELHPTQDIAAT